MDAASAMSFPFRDWWFNLVDTPGHSDFSEDTYRTLTAVDAAIMVIDGAKGVESQTRKLFEVCRLRDIPIITFVNKMDREARDPFELIDEIEKTLALDAAPVAWPVGRASEFAGTWDMLNHRFLPVDADDAASIPLDGGLDDPRVAVRIGDQVLDLSVVAAADMVDTLDLFDRFVQLLTEHRTATTPATEGA